MLHSFSLFL